MIAEISCGEYFWSPRATVTSWPIFRLIDRTVRSGARTYWLRAALPTSSWPWASRPTTEGKIGSPSSSRTTARPSRMTATSLLVVPRSIPMIVQSPCSWLLPVIPRVLDCLVERSRARDVGVELACRARRSDRLGVGVPRRGLSPDAPLELRRSGSRGPSRYNRASALWPPFRADLRFVDDFDHGHQLGIDRVPSQGMCSTCSAPAPGAAVSESSHILRETSRRVHAAPGRRAGRSP